MKWELSIVALLVSLAAAAPQQKGAVNNAANNGDGVSIFLSNSNDLLTDQYLVTFGNRVKPQLPRPKLL